MKEFHALGPPGTGKTTYLGKQIIAAVDKYGPDKIIVASFTRSAAAEIISRNLPIPDENVGTLHAHCFRALGRPQIAEVNIDNWNQGHEGWEVNKREVDFSDPDMMSMGMSPGTQLLNDINRYRAMEIKEENWRMEQRGFWQEWCIWKKEEDLMDFTDLIEIATLTISNAPGNPDVGFFDEAQDFTPKELRLIRHWGSKMEYMILAGDDDQCIYGFKGASPKAFTGVDIPPEQVKILSKSYRLPRAVHEKVEDWISDLSDRVEKKYSPRDADGVVEIVPVTCEDPLGLIDRMDRKKKTMVLASCAYMLKPLMKELKANGIPFWNPYRNKRADWNPLGKKKDTVSTIDRIMTFLRPLEEVWGDKARMWTTGDINSWIKLIKTRDTFTSRGKKSLAAWNPDLEVPIIRMKDTLFYEAALDELFSAHTVYGFLRWLEKRLKSNSTAHYPIDIIRNYGADGIIKPPKLVIGTIHSVKGGEADDVFLFPDLSYAAHSGYVETIEGRDSVIRQFYVGMTRARERLFLCVSNSSISVIF